MKKYPYIILASGLVLLAIAYLVKEVFPVPVVLAFLALIAIILGLALINKIMSILIAIIGLIGTAIFFISIKTYLSLTGDTSGMLTFMVFMPCIVIGFGSYILQRKAIQS
jgi:hypothetical protein